MLIQCRGLTVKGTQCRIKVGKGEFCHYHIKKSHPTTVSRIPQTQVPISISRPKVEANLKPGYIYVYTLASLLGRKTDKNVRTRNMLPNKPDQWVSFDAKKSKMMLVKVGMTTQTVAKRILQWEAKCHHKLACLYPDSHQWVSLSWLDRFRRMLLKDNHKQFDDEFLTFHETERGFFVPRDVSRAEREVHDVLKLRFGKGDVYCTGCVEKSKEANRSRLLRKSGFMESDYNVHVEWFPVPKNRMNEVFSVIDNVCSRYDPWGNHKTNGSRIQHR